MRARKWWRQEIRPLFILALVLFSIRSSLADWNDVPSGSMRPTILEGDRVFVNKLAYDLKVPFTTWHITEWSNPQRGDIVVFFSPHDGTAARQACHRPAGRHHRAAQQCARHQWPADRIRTDRRKSCATLRRGPSAAPRLRHRRTSRPDSHAVDGNHGVAGDANLCAAAACRTDNIS